MKKIDVFDGNALHNEPVSYVLSVEQKCAFWGDKHNVPLDMDLLSKHIMFLGGIGTGKTNAFTQIISQIIDNMNADEGKNDVMIIFDTKGDFYNTFRKKASKNGYVVISNDETATGASGIDYWNVFNEIPHETEEDKRRMEENIVEIAKSLFAEKIQKTNQPFFPNAARDLFGCILKYFLQMKPEECNNENLAEYFHESPTEELRKMLKANKMGAKVSYIGDDRSPQTLGVMSELQLLADEILIGNFKKKGTLSIRDLVREKGGKVIFIEYDIGVGAMLSPIYTLLFDLAIKEALRRKEGERGNVYFITDEFRLLPNLQHIDNAVNFGRSLGLKFMIGIQNVEQIYESYGEHRANSIMSGFLTSVAFRVNDEPSRKFIKDRHGQNRKKETFLSAIAGRGIDEKIREAFVVEDWDINNLLTGEAIIGLPDKEPFKFKFKKM